jgi:hypothetical protein
MEISFRGSVMKRPILAAAFASAAFGAFAQGNITFYNNNEIYGPDGLTGLGPASGGTYVAELLEQTSPGVFAEVPGSICPLNAGFFYGPAATEGLVTVNVPPGNPLTYQIEVWNTAFGATYEAAGEVANPASLTGNSETFTEIVNPGLPSPPNTGLNFPSFSIYRIPEPSVWTLGILGAVPFYWTRRRK